jgi:hypothetical protein
LKLFASPDRETRMALLHHLSEFVEKLDKKAVVEKIWPHLVRHGTFRHCIPYLLHTLANRVLRHSCYYP